MLFPQFVTDAVNRAATTLDGAAGKSINVAKVLKALCQEPLAAGFLGGDRGAWVREALLKLGVEIDFVTVPERTRQCITIIDQSCGKVTELVEESRAVSSSYYEALYGRIAARSKDCAALVMSGTLTPGGPVDFYARCTRLAHQTGALSIVDAKGAPLLESLKAQPGLVKPNRAELVATFGQPLENEEALIAAMRRILQLGARRVVVTAGKEPALALDGHEVWRIHSPTVAAVNPIGSGDAFTAGLAWRLVQGQQLSQACSWAAALGAANALSAMPGDIEPAAVDRLAAEVKVERI